LIKQSIQDLLIATIQNLRKLIGTIQNLPGNAWNALLRIFSLSYVTPSAPFHNFFADSLDFRTDLTLRPLHFTTSRHGCSGNRPSTADPPNLAPKTIK
jgi:hypothetical protein